ncbi:MucBP domain-containing protein, partial [Lactococcus lactis]|uniref:MucBP domain-containing protein n=1 Tax=Lactococcus lactis TaxID=1358 RepID=UPI002417E117
MKLIKLATVSTLALLALENGGPLVNATTYEVKSELKQEVENDKQNGKKVSSSSMNSEVESSNSPLNEEISTSSEAKDSSATSINDEDPSKNRESNDSEKKSEQSISSTAQVTPKPYAASSPEVNIPDYYLKYDILKSLNIPVTGTVETTPVTQDDLLKLTSLSMTNGAPLGSLEGIQYATNLTSFTLTTSFRSTIETNLLSGLSKLTSLTIVGSGTGKISNLGFLENLTALQSLNIGQNSITDISPLKNLTALSSLTLDTNKITSSSVPVLGGLKNLTSLQMSATGVTDYSWIVPLTNLYQLSISNNNLVDANVRPISELTNLTNLYVQRNNLTDLNTFKNMPYVELLQAESNQISDLTPLSEFKGIQQINLKNNNITDISPLTKVTTANANYIMLAGNHISDISGLGNLLANEGLSVDATGQTVTLPAITVYKGDEVKVDNPFKSIDGTIPALSNISPTNGVYDDSSKQIIVSNNSLTSISGQFRYKEWDGHFGFTATVRQPINLKVHGAPVTVEYVDEDGNKLSEDDILSGKDAGEIYETSPKYIAGWILKTTPANAQGTFTEETQTVTYVYEKSNAMPVTVKYVDENNKELAPSDILTGEVGDPYETSAKSIAGWTVKTTPANAQGTFTEEAQT